MKLPFELLEDIEVLPTGDPEVDHVLLDKATVDTLKLCLERFDYEDQRDSLHILVFALIQKWETIEQLWYA